MYSDSVENFKTLTTVTEVSGDVSLWSRQRNFIDPRVEILKILIAHIIHCKEAILTFYNLFTDANF